MAIVTFQVLDGADRGRKYEDLQTPVTIGREEGNTIQLNDERVSRFHLKIQEDQDKVVLTDLESTNGTRVNGEEAHLHILRHGDVVNVGRSVLLYGNREQIAQRLANIRGGELKTISNDSDKIDLLDLELNWAAAAGEDSPLHLVQPPDLPDRLGPAQLAQLAELLTYLHIRMRHLLNSVEPNGGTKVTLDQHEWQNLTDLQNRLAEYLHSIGEPPPQDGGES